MRRLIGALVVGASLLVASPAQARTEWIFDKTYKTERPTHIDILGFAWLFGTSRFGVAGWFGFPLLDQGFIPANDVLDVEIGVVVVRVGEEVAYFGVVPAGGLRWGLDLTEDWQIFLTAKGGWQIGLGPDSFNKLFLSFSIGALWEFSKHMYLRLETGNYGVLQAGVTIPF